MFPNNNSICNESCSLSIDRVDWTIFETPNVDANKAGKHNSLTILYDRFSRSLWISFKETYHFKIIRQCSYNSYPFIRSVLTIHSVRRKKNLFKVCVLSHRDIRKATCVYLSFILLTKYEGRKKTFKDKLRLKLFLC